MADGADLLTPVAEVCDGAATARLWRREHGGYSATAHIPIGTSSAVLRSVPVWMDDPTRGALLLWLRGVRESAEGRRPRR